MHARPVQAGAPYTLDEVTQLVNVVYAGPDRVRRTGPGALLLGLGYGIAVPDTSQLSGTGDGMASKGQLLAVPPSGLPVALTQHYAELQAFTAADWKGLRA